MVHKCSYEQQTSHVQINGTHVLLRLVHGFHSFVNMEAGMLHYLIYNNII